MTGAMTLTLDRSSLSLADLVVVGDRATATAGAGYWTPLTDSEGLTLPSFQPRRLYAPDSAWVAGKQLLGSVLDQGTLQVDVWVIGSNVSELKTRKDALEAAAYQFAYAVTLAVDGATLGVWGGEPAWLQWQAPTPRDRADFMARVTLQIPVNP